MAQFCVKPGARFCSEVIQFSRLGGLRLFQTDMTVYGLKVKIKNAHGVLAFHTIVKC